jgi:hypothetical protein
MHEQLSLASELAREISLHHMHPGSPSYQRLQGVLGPSFSPISTDPLVSLRWLVLDALQSKEVCAVLGAPPLQSMQAPFTLVLHTARLSNGSILGSI